MELYARSLYKIDCFKHAWLSPLQQGSTLTRSIRYLGCHKCETRKSNTRYT